MELDREILERIFGDEENYGAGYPEGGDEHVFPDGRPSAFCTNWARYVRRVLGERCEIHGFSEEDNPTSSIARLCGGHDFALVDGRYVVDGWARNVECVSPRAVLDLEDPVDAATAAELLGDRSLWKRGDEIERGADLRVEPYWSRAMDGTSFDLGPSPAHSI